MSKKLVGLVVLAACTVNGKAFNPFGGGSNPPPPAPGPTAQNPVAAPATPSAPSAPNASPAPVANAPAIAGRPAWCGRFDPDGMGAGYDGDFDYVIKQYGYSVRSIVSISRAVCANRSPEAVGTAMRARADWMRVTGMTEADMADITPVMANEANEPLDYRVDNYDPAGKRVADLSPVDELRYLGKVSSGTQLLQLAWWLDSLPSGVHEPARIFFLERCDYAISDTSWNDQRPSIRFAIWGLCAGDANALSRKQLDADIAASKVTDPGIRFVLHARLGRAKANAAKYEAEMQALAAKDPAIKKIVYELPAKAAKEWAAYAAQYKELFAATLAIEDALRTNSRKALAGCHEVFWPWWTKIVATLDTSAREKWSGLLRNSPAAQAVAQGFAICHGEDGQGDAVKHFAYTMSGVVNGGANVRGVHGAIYVALGAIARSVQFDDRNLGNTLSLPNYTDGIANMGNQGGRGMRGGHQGRAQTQGVIGTVEKAGDTVRITFKKEMYQATTCDNWVETDQLDRVENGKIYYREICTRRSRKTFDKTPPPVEIAGFLAAGVKVGRVGLFVGTNQGGPVMPITISNGDAVVAYLGVPHS
jgi:hypothetical protein